MRQFYTAFALTLLLFGGVAAYSELVFNSRYLDRTRSALVEWSRHLPELPAPVVLELETEAKRRARLYDDIIQKDHLVDGMVVSRNLTSGVMLDQCDSLLFSSLRYVSLVKLGWLDRAKEAWDGISNAHRDGTWLRHPRCRHSTSRDMLVGLLAALSQRPDGYDQHLLTLIRRIERHDGYFSTGPIYVSYLSPGLARFLARMAPATHLREDDLPPIIRDGYSTAELEVLVVRRGYETHLGGLSAWLEMELDAGSDHDGNAPSSIAAKLTNNLVAPFASDTLLRQRLDWITDRLVQTDPTNLFFRYLRLRAAGALTPAVRQRLLAELLAMRQFPRSGLPANCDREADYLWQRASREPTHGPLACTREYSGSDFLWMASLLLEGREVDAPIPLLAH